MKTGGFSYIEVLIAVALFAIALAAILPTLSQAGRNLAFASSGYEAHLRAQDLMLTVRGELQTGQTSTALARAGAAVSEYSIMYGDSSFTVWFIGGEYDGFVYSTSNAPMAAANVTGFAATDNRTVIVVAMWNERGGIAARAVGVA
ncbi:MAG: hypothetical protein FWD90_12995 [Defluviitaleaceae bacterium]|nr:hypothetical protein [Defluviitaleaceae bacterium]